MSADTQTAVDWTLQQTVTNEGITKDTPSELVEKVREYFNAKKSSTLLSRTMICILSH